MFSSWYKLFTMKKHEHPFLCESPFLEVDIRRPLWPSPFSTYLPFKFRFFFFLEEFKGDGLDNSFFLMAQINNDTCKKF
jgi:hypothetical protein